MAKHRGGAIRGKEKGGPVGQAAIRKPANTGTGNGAARGSITAAVPVKKKPANNSDGSSSSNSSNSSSNNSNNSHQQLALPFPHQQRLLDVFSRALGPTLASPDLTAALQAVKRALFERDFEGAFNGNQQDPNVADVHPLNAYAARWSPPRALCYAAILRSPLVQEHWATSQSSDNTGTNTSGDASAPDSTDSPQEPNSNSLRMVAIGGGAAEAVAFGSVLSQRNGIMTQDSLVLVDSGPWGNVVDELRATMTTATKDARPKPALVEPADRLQNVMVLQQDILEVDDDAMKTLLVGDATNTSSTITTTTLVTLFFTLNEIFTAGGIGPTATFLLRLTAAAPAGTLLLVVDSPGSYAETSLGAQARRYPMRWLLDKILLQDASGSANASTNTNTDKEEVAEANPSSPAWTKLHQDDAIWFRLPQSLLYPIRLEDMRYQVHLYVRK